MQLDPKSQSLTGILVATTIVIVWIGSLKFLSFIDIYQSIPVWILLAIYRGSSPENSHQATSSNYAPIWSFLTCYHFGYHWEYHEYPWLAWYELLSVRQISSPHANPPLSNPFEIF